MENKALLCRFASRSVCRDGSRCQFSHNEHESIEIPDNVCIFHLQNKCYNGDTCRFDHWTAKDIYESVGIPWTDIYHPEAAMAAMSCTSSSDPSSTFDTSNYDRLTYQEGAEEEEEEEGSSLDHPFYEINTCSNESSSDTSTTLDTSEEPSSSSSNSGLSSVDGKSYRMVEFKPRTASQSNKMSNKTSTSGSETLKTYAQVLNVPSTGAESVDMEALKLLPLCPFAIISNECPNRDSCHYLHGNLCDLCDRLCLHPYDEEQSKGHHEECVKEHEKQMELSFAIQRSMDKNCGICMDAILDKDPIERRFGILEKCNHIFCLTCIRKWRQTKQFDNRTIRACPECRVNSDFVVPSKYWVEDKDDKDKLIDQYKNALSNKPCKYFKEGRGECPFAGACFYRHAYPDGRKADMPPPRVRRTRQNQEGELETLRDMLLWNYLEVRDDRQWLLTLDMDELLEMREFGLFDTDSDDSDFSD